MKDKTLKRLFRNLTCLSVGLLLLFTTAVFVVTGLYQHHIDELIDQATLLTDNKYPFWGTNNPNNTYQHEISLVDLNKNATVQPMVLEYSYSYDSVAFGQGDQGTIKYLDQWKRLLPNNSQNNPTLRTLNPAIERLYGYEYYSPFSRTFTLNFNFLWQSVKDMIPNIYGLYLSQFYLHDTDTVTKAVLNPLNLPDYAKDLILNHQDYGWWVPSHLKHWFRLVHLLDEAVIREEPMFETLQKSCRLTAQQLLGLVGKRSTLRQLSLALNGTIKNKVEGKAMGYEGCDPFCSEDQLVSIQLVTGLLSNSALMGSLSLGKLTHQLNTSYPGPVQYLQFCQSRPQLTCIDPVNAISTFGLQILNNFTLMERVAASQDNYELVQTLFGIQNPMQDGSYGQSLVEYILYLQQQIFSPYDQQTGVSDQQAYKLIFPNYQYLLSTLNYLQTAIPLELVSRAAIATVQQNKYSCHDFFAGKYVPYEHLCDGGDADPTQPATLRLFVQAYSHFQSTRATFLNLTTMDYSTASQFLQTDSSSLFATMMGAIQSDLSLALQCKSDPCSSLELMARQWGGSRTVLDHLPEKYFPGGTVAIADLDYEHRFSNSDPRYHKMMGQVLSQTQSSELLSDGDQSLKILLNLLAYRARGSSGDVAASRLLRYMQRVVVDTYFGGYFIEADQLSLFTGIDSPGLAMKQEMAPLRGGTPWLSSTVTMVEMEHSTSRFSRLNTGIYAKQKIRQIVLSEGHSNSSSQYTTYRAQFENAVETLLSDKIVNGTNMLGFHQSLSKDELLNVQIEPVHYSATLNNGTEGLKYKEIPAIRFTLSDQDTLHTIPLGVEEHNQRFAKLDNQSYFMVEPLTGLTLELSLSISVYANVTTMPLYDSTLPSELPLFRMKVFFQRGDTSGIEEIRSQQQEMRDLSVILIVCAGVCMLTAVVMAVLYANKRKKARGSDIMNSLVSSEQQV